MVILEGGLYLGFVFLKLNEILVNKINMWFQIVGLNFEISTLKRTHTVWMLKFTCAEPNTN